ncbi:hypothetical protein BAC1_01585 [uncultured bacterium]|nr:hypothetical protein BAC1_01585 [uncultured bacterium]
MSELYKEIIGDSILKDIIDCLKNDKLTVAMMLTYCAMDAMAFLALPKGQDFVEKKNFMAWIRRYMKADASQPYQYQPIDVYSARCGLIHNYGAESALSKCGKSKIFIYSYGRKNHIFKPTVKPNIVIISVDTFISDFLTAVNRFLVDIEKDYDLRNRVDSRLKGLFRVISESDLGKKVDKEGV